MIGRLGVQPSHTATEQLMTRHEGEGDEAARQWAPGHVRSCERGGPGAGPSHRWVRAARRSSRAMWLLVGGFLLVGVPSEAVQLAAGASEPGVLALRWVGLLAFLAFALLEFALGLACWALFETGEPLRRAWFFLSLGSGFRLLGMAAAAWSSGLAAAEAAAVRQVGVAALNPITALFTAAGLLIALRAHRKAGTLRWPGPAGAALITLAAVASALLGLDAARVVTLAAPSGRPVWFAWLIGPVLGVVLAEAVLLYRAAAAIGDGLVASCWASLAAAVLVAMAGQWTSWAVQRGALPAFFADAGALLWYGAELGFVLAPAYQIEAVVRARSVLRALREA